MFLMGSQAIFAEPAKVDAEIALEDLFSEEDLAALREEDDAVLFDEISQSEQDPEELFQ